MLFLCHDQTISFGRIHCLTYLTTGSDGRIAINSKLRPLRLIFPTVQTLLHPYCPQTTVKRSLADIFYTKKYLKR